jgi:hypothetical protein
MSEEKEYPYRERYVYAFILGIHFSSTIHHFPNIMTYSYISISIILISSISFVVSTYMALWTKAGYNNKTIMRWFYISNFIMVLVYICISNYELYGQI